MDEAVYRHLPCRFQLGEHVYAHGNLIDMGIVIAVTFVPDRVMYSVRFPDPTGQRPAVYEVDEKNVEAVWTMRR